MNEKLLKTGDSVTYGQSNYKVIDNRITKDKNKTKILILINVISLLIAFGVYILYILSSAMIGVKEQVVQFDFIDMIIYLFVFVAAYVLFIIAHEYVHYLTYRYAGNIPKDKLKFGIVLKSGMAYCISLEPTTVKASRLSLMMPFYVLVIPLIIISVLTQNGFLAFLSALFAGGSAGDIWYMWTLKKDSREKYIIEAMPSGKGYEIGYLLLDKTEN